MTAFRHPTAAGAVALALGTLIAYVPAMRGGFVWDDDYYVTHNRALRDIDGLVRIWLVPGTTPQYYPLVHTTFWLEYHLWGQRPAGYHIVNVLLHIAGALLLWLVLQRLAVPGAWFAAAIFAVHPVHVESVAWITERKNVLSGALYLGALLAYIRFARLDLPRIIRPRFWQWYALAFALFVCALFAKTVTCSLPAVILLLLWWKRDRLDWRDIVPLGPMFLVGLLMGLFTAWVEKRYVGVGGPEWMLSVTDRCLIAGRAVWFYVGKLLWPAKLTFIYPRWRIDSGVWWQYLYPAAALALLAVLWLLRGRIGKGPLVAALFFGGTLGPALGFVNVYPMRYSFVADHFQYLASLGPICLFAALAVTWAARTGRARPYVPPVLAAALLATLGFLTWRQGHVYHDIETLWADTLAKNPAAWVAHSNLGSVLTVQGRIEEAIAHEIASLRLNPDQWDVHYNLGVTLEARGEWEEALRHYREAVRLRPGSARARTALGAALFRAGRVDEAFEHVSEALRLNPDFGPAREFLRRARNEREGGQAPR